MYVGIPVHVRVCMCVCACVRTLTRQLCSVPHQTATPVIDLPSAPQNAQDDDSDDDGEEDEEEEEAVGSKRRPRPEANAAAQVGVSPFTPSLRVCVLPRPPRMG
jgi:hypothetical protein